VLQESVLRKLQICDVNLRRKLTIPMLIFNAETADKILFLTRQTHNTTNTQIAFMTRVICSADMSLRTFYNFGNV
jgi:hypothetical protein